MVMANVLIAYVLMAQVLHQSETISVIEAMVKHVNNKTAEVRAYCHSMRARDMRVARQTVTPAHCAVPGHRNSYGCTSIEVFMIVDSTAHVNVMANNQSISFEGAMTVKPDKNGSFDTDDVKIKWVTRKDPFRRQMGGPTCGITSTNYHSKLGEVPLSQQHTQHSFRGMCVCRDTAESERAAGVTGSL